MKAATRIALEEARERMWAEFGGRCGYCGLRLTRSLRIVPSQATIDHIDGKRKENRDAPDNLMLCCHGCNSSKFNLTLQDFRIRCALRAMGAPKFNREQWTWLERQNFFSYGMRHLFHFEKVRGIRPRLVA